jgi:hypothetical protein
LLRVGEWLMSTACYNFVGGAYFGCHHGEDQDASIPGGGGDAFDDTCRITHRSFCGALKKVINRSLRNWMAVLNFEHEGRRVQVIIPLLGSVDALIESHSSKRFLLPSCLTDK